MFTLLLLTACQCGSTAPNAFDGFFEEGPKGDFRDLGLVIGGPLGDALDREGVGEPAPDGGPWARVHTHEREDGAYIHGVDVVLPREQDVQRALTYWLRPSSAELGHGPPGYEEVPSRTDLWFESRFGQILILWRPLDGTAYEPVLTVRKRHTPSSVFQGILECMVYGVRPGDTDVPFLDTAGVRVVPAIGSADLAPTLTPRFEEGRVVEVVWKVNDPTSRLIELSAEELGSLERVDEGVYRCGEDGRLTTHHEEGVFTLSLRQEGP